MDDRDALLREIRELKSLLEQANTQLRFHEVERAKLQEALQKPDAPPLPVIHADALLTFSKESWYEGLTAGAERFRDQMLDWMHSVKFSSGLTIYKAEARPGVPTPEEVAQRFEEDRELAIGERALPLSDWTVTAFKAPGDR